MNSVFQTNIFINYPKATNIHKLATSDFHQGEPLDSLLVMVTQTLFEEESYMYICDNQSFFTHFL